MKKIFTIKIFGHEWDVRLVSKEVLRKELGFDALGFTFIDRFTIDVLEECTDQEISHILAHELTHAMLCSQGRAFQKKFTQEELCEFMSWNHETLDLLISECETELFKIRKLGIETNEQPR